MPVVRTTKSADTADDHLTAGRRADRAPGRRVDAWARIGCVAGALLAVVPFALCSFEGTTAAEITASIAAKATLLQIGAGVAALSGALLILAAVRLGQRVDGTAGRVLGAAGVAVAVLFVAYYASFGTGGVVVANMLTETDPSVGIGVALLVNLTEVTRFAPGLALVVAALAARRRLPLAIRIAAGVLAAMTVFPMTGWIAALLIPLWLGISAAVVRCDAN